MTMVKIDKKEKSIELSGHTKDPIVCHALSGIVDSVCNWLYDNTGAIIEASDGYCKLSKPLDASDKEKEFYDTYFDFFIYAIVQLAYQNQGNIEIQEI